MPALAVVKIKFTIEEFTGEKIESFPGVIRKRKTKFQDLDTQH